jgi:PAS domain S-box-containing protein
MDFLSLVARQAATAVTNAQLLTKVQHYAKDLEARVTERHRVEEALRESEQRFRLVISSISDHIYVTEVTKEGRRINLYLSPHVESMTGYPWERFMADWRFWPSTVIHPDDRAAADAQAAQLLQGHNSEVEYRLVRADSKVIWVRDSARVQTEGSSKITYGVVSDITERKRVELERAWLTNELRDVNQTLDERVRARTAELQAILDAVGEGIVVTDRAGVIQYLNPALERLTGYSEEETLGGTPRMWSSGRQSASFYAQMWQTILAGQTWRGELVNQRKDGTFYDVVLTITPITDPGGKPLGFVGAQHDITPFKQMDRLKSDFISTAAHELRTPLTSIQGFSEILLTRQLDEERRKRFLTFINQQAEALAAITDDLLSLSKLEAGKGFEATDIPVDLKEIVEEVLFGFREHNHQHHYVVSGPASWPRIKGDPVKLAQLFKNLLSNATKYSPDGGNVMLRAETETTYDLLHLTVTDQGIGMTPEQLSHMFDRFYRADASNTAIGGTGLGMSISQLIVKKHRGKIWVESEYGQGTSVHVLFPLPGRPPYVLIIEDEEGLRRLQQISLELEGFTVLPAEKGQPGLELAQTCLPDLILLDLNLPEMSGFSVLDNLKNNHLTKDIPIIITSALDQPEEIEKAIEKGADDYLVKPYGMGDLAIRINRALTETKRETSA